MAFPTDPVPVVVEIAPGADPAADPGTWSWQDITTRVRLQDRIEMVTGRQNEASTIDPSRCTMRLDNTTGDFTPRNPYGQWYGTLGRNTPLRVSIRRAEDAFARTSSAGWSNADSGQTWTGYGGGGSVLSADFTISGGKGSHSVPAASAYRVSWLAGLSVLDCRVRLSGVTLPFSDVTGGSVEPGNILLRMQSETEYYMARVEITTAEAVQVKLYDPDGAQLASATVAGLTHTSSQTLEVLAEIVGNRLSMKVWPTSGSEPSGWHVTATDDSLTLPGGVGVRTGVASGNTNTKPVVASYESVTVHVDRFCGFVSSWPPRWDPTGNDSTVPIQADGVLRRLSQGNPPSRSPWRRMVTSRALSGLLAYWPCEDDVSATRAASGLPGGSPMTATSSVRFAALDGDLFANSGGVTLGFGAGLVPGTAAGSRAANIDQGTLTGTVPAGTSSPVAWSVSWVARPVTSGATYSMMRWDTPGGSNSQWEYRHANVSSQSGLWGRRASDGVWVEYAALFDDSPTLREYRVEAWQDSVGGIGLRLWVDGVKISDAFWTDTLARVTQVTANPDAANPDALAVAHIQVWDTEDPPALGVLNMSSTAQPTDSYGVKVYPHQRWINEAAQDRLFRLAAEDGLTIDVPPVASVAVARMGQQADGTPLDLYRHCETTDQGVLYELGFGLGYVPRDSRYNRAPAVALDYAAGQVAPPLEPVDDDQLLINRVVARRVNGSEATTEDEDSITAAGVYERSVDVNLATDSSLTHHASWRVHVGSTAVMRWPQIRVNLARSPELIDAVLSARVQSRMTVDNPPTQAVGDDIDVLIEGYAETIGHTEWLVGFNTSPARVWDVAVWDADRYDTPGSETDAPFVSGTDTALSVAATAGVLWSGADAPFDINAGGVRLTVTAVSGSSSPQTFTVAATPVNGITKTIPAGTAVRVWQPAAYAL